MKPLPLMDVEFRLPFSMWYENSLLNNILIKQHKTIRNWENPWTMVETIRKLTKKLLRPGVLETFRKTTSAHNGKLKK